MKKIIGTLLVAAFIMTNSNVILNTKKISSMAIGKREDNLFVVKAVYDGPYTVDVSIPYDNIEDAKQYFNKLYKKVK